ncbi:MAG: hypothetical protein ACI9YL_001459 [Luteibaculaceae bacterium]|jgi:hypothetical protein
MLLPDNIHPENTVYFNGAMVLNLLQTDSSIEFLELYNQVKSNGNISFQTYILCLDWLYLIDAAKLNNGKVELCS